MNNSMLTQDKLLLCTVGSHLYGTNIPSSDKDFVGIFFPPIDYILGLLKTEIVDMSIKENDKTLTSDTTYYTLAKFARLAMDNNPNILELLFVNKENILLTSPEAEELFSLKKYFLSQNIKNKFLGYAFSQRHKLLIKRENYDLIEKGLDFLSKSAILYLNEIEVNPYFLYTALDTITLGGKANPILNFKANSPIKKVIAILEARKKSFGGRRAGIKEVGYDRKFAMHLLRLLIEGLTLLETSNLIFPLPEAKFLLKIRNEEIPLEEILELSYDYEEKVEKALLVTELPTKPNFDIINNFIIKTYKNKIIGK